MSPPPTPDDPITGTAAAPLDAIRGDAVASGDEVRTRQAVDSSRRTETLLMIATEDALPEGHEDFWLSLFRIPRNKLIKIKTWKELSDTIFSYERIDTLILLTHGGLSPSELYIGGHQRVITKLATGPKEKDDSDYFIGLNQWSGSIGTLKIEGCKAGGSPTALYGFADEINVTRVEAWSMSHYLSSYGGVATGDRADAIQKWRDSGLLERASPWLPKTGDGAIFSPSDLEQELLKNGSFAHMGEVFGDFLDFGLTPFIELMNNPDFEFDEEFHFTRASGVRATLEARSRTQAAEHAKLITPPPDSHDLPILHKVVAIPTRVDYIYRGPHHGPDEGEPYVK